MNAKLRKQVIAEWRGLPELPFTQDTSVSAGAVVMTVMKQLGLGERLREEEVSAAWKEIVGDFLAEHSQPQRLQEGILYVSVLQPAMLYELDRTFRTDILQKLRKRFGRAVRDVRFRIG